MRNPVIRGKHVSEHQELPGLHGIVGVHVGLREERWICHPHCSGGGGVDGGPVLGGACGERVCGWGLLDDSFKVDSAFGSTHLPSDRSRRVPSSAMGADTSSNPGGAAGFEGLLRRVGGLGSSVGHSHNEIQRVVRCPRKGAGNLKLWELRTHRGKVCVLRGYVGRSVGRLAGMDWQSAPYDAPLFSRPLEAKVVAFGGGSS